VEKICISVSKRHHNMNSNALILLAILFGLLISFFLAMKALKSQPSICKKIYVGLTLLILGSSLIGGISVLWRMTHPQPYTSEPAPLPAQSQVIIQQLDRLDQQDPLAPAHVTRSSL